MDDLVDGEYDSYFDEHGLGAMGAPEVRNQADDHSGSAEDEAVQSTNNRRAITHAGSKGDGGGGAVRVS